MVVDSGWCHSGRDKLTSAATPAGSAQHYAALPGLSSASPGRLWTSYAGRKQTSSRPAPSGWRHPAVNPSTDFYVLPITTRINTSTDIQQQETCQVPGPGGGPNSTMSSALSCSFWAWLLSRIFSRETVRVEFFTASLDHTHIISVNLRSTSNRMCFLVASTLFSWHHHNTDGQLSRLIECVFVTF